MSPDEKRKHKTEVAKTCQACCGMGGHGEHSSVGTCHEFWRACVNCNGTGRKDHRK